MASESKQMSLIITSGCLFPSHPNSTDSHTHIHTPAHPHTHTHTDDWTPPDPAAAQTTLSPATYSQPVANSFRQAWERGCIQAGSALRAARSGRTNRGSGQETGPLPQGLRPLANPLSSKTTPSPCQSLSVPLCSLCTCPGLWSLSIYVPT